MGVETTAQSRLRRERDRFVALAFAAAHFLVETDDALNISFASGALRALGAEPEALTGKNLADFVAPTDRAYLRELLTRLDKLGRIEGCRIRLGSRDDESVEALLGGCLLPNQPDRRFFALLLPSRVEDDSQIAGPEQTPQYGSLLDRQEFLKAAQGRIMVAGRLSLDEQVTMLEIEAIQSLRDAGRSGDAARVTEAIGAVLRAFSIGGDTAGDLGGGRFGVVHAGNTSETEISARVGEVLEDLSGEIDGLEPSVASGGLDDVAVRTPQSKVRTFSLSFEQSNLSEVDAAKALVYAVNKFATQKETDFSIGSLQQGANLILQEAVTRVDKVRDVIEKRNFDIVYQPIVDLFREKVHHLEALTRLTGFSNTQDFIQFTEDIGMIEDFDLALLQKILEQFTSHAQTGWRPSVAINLSARSLTSPLFLAQFDRIVEPHASVIPQLLIEVTETVVVSDLSALNAVLQDLRGRGFRVCIDDVGTGSTSFQSLYDLTVDFAKIDGRFVRSALADPRDMAMLRSIVRTGRELGFALIAEQIEERDQAVMLNDLGVQYGQGYLFGRPNLDYSQFYAKPKERV